MTLQEFKQLLSDKAQLLLAESREADPVESALRLRGQEDIPARAIAEQIACRKSAVGKIPAFVERSCLLEPVAVQQCSSEATARYKAALMRGHNLVDLTGGLCVDAFCLARAFNTVAVCESDGLLCRIAGVNAQRMGVDNVTVHECDGARYLGECLDNSLDWVFVDPSRRNARKRFVGLCACMPNVVELAPLLLRKASNVCIKASPAIEIRRVREELPHISKVHIVSVEGECKEVLLIMSRRAGHEETGTMTVSLLNSVGQTTYSISRPRHAPATARKVIAAEGWFYDPDPAVVKARLSQEVADEFGLSFVNERVDYMTGRETRKSFPGRMFRIVSTMPWQRRSVKNYLDKNGVSRAHVARREFPLAPERIKEMLGLGDGGEEYLFFTVDSLGKRLFIHCRKGL